VVGVRYALLIVALVLAACGSSSAASSHTGSAPPPAGPPAHCGPAGARTMAASTVARVFEQGGVVSGCSSKTGRTVRLGQTRTCLGKPRVGVVAVAGELAAYATQTCGVDTGAASVVVRRLSDGRQLGSFEAVSPPIRPESYRSVVSVVLRPDGSVAWIGQASSIISHRTELQVQAVSAGVQRQLDRGTGIGPRSLRLHGTRLTWSDAGRTRSATLR
jgi:hypothetical protein